MNDREAAPRAAERFRRIAAADAADLIRRHRAGVLPELAIYDVRDPRSYAAGHIDGAAHLAEAQFAGLIGKLRKSVPVILYCDHGNASQVFAAAFADFRYSEVYSVDGGFGPLAAALAPDADRVPARLRADASPALNEFLGEHGFDPEDLDAPRESGLTPLMRAALGGQVELMRELLAAGVAIDRRNGDGNNALWLACVSNVAAAVDLLTGAGIAIDNRNDTGATCLMYAASSGRHAILARLIEAGADAAIRNFDDARAVDLCASIECLRLLRHTAD